MDDYDVRQSYSVGTPVKTYRQGPGIVLASKTRPNTATSARGRSMSATRNPPGTLAWQQQRDLEQQQQQYLEQQADQRRNQDNQQQQQQQQRRTAAYDAGREFGTNYMLDNTGHWVDPKPPPLPRKEGISEVVSYLDESPRAADGNVTLLSNPMVPTPRNGSSTSFKMASHAGKQTSYGEDYQAPAKPSDHYDNGNGYGSVPAPYTHDRQQFLTPGSTVNVGKPQKPGFATGTRHLGGDYGNQYLLQRPASAGGRQGQTHQPQRPTSAQRPSSAQRPVQQYGNQRPTSTVGRQAQQYGTAQRSKTARPGTTMGRNKTVSILEGGVGAMSTRPSHPFDQNGAYAVASDLSSLPVNPGTGFAWEAEQGNGGQYARPSSANPYARPATPAANSQYKYGKTNNENGGGGGYGGAPYPEYAPGQLGHAYDTNRNLNENDLQQARETMGQHTIAGSPHTRLVGGKWTFVEDHHNGNLSQSLTKSLTSDDLARTKDICLGQHVVPGSANARLVGSCWRHMPQPLAQDPMWTDYYGPLGGGVDKCVYYGRKYNDPKPRWGF